MTRPPGSGCGTPRRARRACSGDRRLVEWLEVSLQEETEGRQSADAEIQRLHAWLGDPLSPE